MRFSIIVPVYNVAPYLSECLDSVLYQTCSNWECICVDDGSSDGSGIILDEYAGMDGRFRIVHQKNAGVGAARNAAIALAKGDYLCFLDADDLYHKEALRVLDEAIEKNGDVDALCLESLHRSTDVSDGFLQRELSAVESKSGKLTYNPFSYKHFREQLGCVVFNRCTYGNLCFDSKVVGEDMLVSFKMYWRTNTWIFIDASLYFYRQRVTSAMHRVPSVRSIRDVLTLEYELIQLLNQNGDKWRLSEMLPLFRWNATAICHEHGMQMIRLSDADLRAVFPDYLRMQHALQELRGFPILLKFETIILSCITCPSCVRLVIRNTDWIVRMYGALKGYILRRR